MGWDWGNPCTMETKTDCIRRVREAATLTALSLPQAIAVPHGRSPWASSSFSEKREPGGGQPAHLALWATLRESLLWLCNTGDCRGIWGAPLLEIWLWWRRKEGLATTSIWILADQIHTCSAQLVIPNSGFAHLQNQLRSILWPGKLVRCRSAWFRFSNEEFAGTRAWFAHTQARSWDISTPTMKSIFWPHLIRRAGDYPGGFAGQHHLSQEMDKQSW